MSRNTVAHIDLSAFAHNLRRVQALAQGSRVMAVVKADAYGHGLVRAAKALSAAELFAVATLEEALTLRRAGLAHPIVLLEGFHDADELAVIQHHALEVVVHNRQQIEALSAQADLNLRRVWLKFDSGMHRLGFPCDRARDIHRWVQSIAGIGEVALMSHFACADEPGHPLNQQQLQRFDLAVQGLPGQQSLANSAALVALPESRRDWVRSGIMLYGVSPFADRTAAELGLRPVMSLSTRLMAVHDLPAGEAVGYGAAYRCPVAMRVGIAAIGYGDGYPRHAANGAPVLVRGQPSALIGRVSMDMIALDLRHCPDAQLGDDVILWGPDLPVENVAAHADAIPYQLLCGITRRVEIRTLKQSAQCADSPASVLGVGV